MSKKIIILTLKRYDNIVTKGHRILRDLFIWIFTLQITVYLKWPRHAFLVIHTSVRSRLCSTSQTSFFPKLPAFLIFNTEILFFIMSSVFIVSTLNLDGFSIQKE